MRQRPEAENYKVIDLEKGETKTVDIKGVNYAGTDLSSVDSKVADVTIDGKDKKFILEKDNGFIYDTQLDCHFFSFCVNY